MNPSKIILCYIILLLALVTSAFSAPEVCQPDSIFPESGHCGYDVLQYDLYWQWDDSINFLQAQVKISLIPDQDSDQITLDFDGNYTVFSISEHTTPRAFERTAGDLFIYADFQKDKVTEILIKYGGTPQAVSFFDTADPNATTPICLISEPNLSSYWFPLNDRIDDKALFTLEITIPAQYAAASVGRLISVTDANGNAIALNQISAGNSSQMRTWHYRNDHPMAPYLFTVCVDYFDLSQTEILQDTLQLDFIQSNLAKKDEAWRLANLYEEMTRCFENFLGPYPFKDAGSIILNHKVGGALETQTRAIYGIDSLPFGETVFAHEVAHQWVGNAVSIQDWSDTWIKEGFATYAEYLWEECTRGADSAHILLEDSYRKLVNIDLGIRDTARYAREFTTSYPLSDTFFYDSAVLKEDIASICGKTLNAEHEKIIHETMEDGRVSGVELWNMMPDFCEKLALNREKREKIYDIFGISHTRQLTEDPRKSGPLPVSRDPYDLYSINTYLGGSLVFYVLDQSLGRELFTHFLHELVSRYSDGNVSTQELMDLATEIGGSETNELIKRWLYYEQVPDLPGIATYAAMRFAP